jgi:hypothetical protein
VCVPSQRMQPTDWHNATRFEQKIVDWLKAGLREKALGTPGGGSIGRSTR